MKINISNSFLGLMLMLAVASCKTRKQTVKVPVNADSTATMVNKKSENLELLKSKDVGFNTLSLKGKARLEFNGKEDNASINLRMKKDEVIWLSITGFAGIEGARVRITPDSIQVLNRLQGVYLNKPFSYIYNYGSRQLNFKTLQSILLGNTISDFMSAGSDLELEAGNWVLSGKRGDLGYRLLFNTLLKTEVNNLSDLKSGQALKVTYGDYQQIDATLYPTTVAISTMSGTKKVAIDLDFSKIERNLPLDFPFNVPKKYEVLN
ncbi:hypothetical protein PBAL39_04863 [Pedobacter sp. BAL39]|nr:hypothetical protein PBAL39_04863 [Pedobacter sp. BAL39]